MRAQCAVRTGVLLWLCQGLAAVSLFVGEPPRFLEIRPGVGEIAMKIAGSATLNSRLETSADLRNWTPLVTFPKSATTLSHTDSSAPYLPFRYYRVVEMPTADALTGDHLPTADGDVVIHPINHATLILGWKDKVIHIDPVGGASRFQGRPKPTMVLITDVHGDHLDSVTLNAIGAAEADIVAPQAVFQMLSSGLRTRTKVLANGATTELQGIQIEAIPMYNITSARLSYHSKGRGNGYVLTIGGKRLYVCGDTEDIAEMRALKSVDAAFICMNLPFTMTVDQAASAVREFRPAIVYPYHFSGSSVTRFQELVGRDLGIEVRLRKWY